jgi:hypothetical protein
MSQPPNQRPALDRLADALRNRSNVERRQGFTSAAEDHEQQLTALNELREAVRAVLAKPPVKGGRRIGLVDAAALGNALNRVS